MKIPKETVIKVAKAITQGKRPVDEVLEYKKLSIEDKQKVIEVLIRANKKALANAQHEL